LQKPQDINYKVLPYDYKVVVGGVDLVRSFA
ncbi:MAG: hypothetical protein ACI8TS_001573, partial [Flavobacteriales bacterium]